LNFCLIQIIPVGHLRAGSRLSVISSINIITMILMVTEYGKGIYANTIHSKKDLEIISLLNKNTNWAARLNKLRIFLLFILLVINISAFSFWESILMLLVPIFSLAIIAKGYFI
jgi:hypothetical protein